MSNSNNIAWNSQALAPGAAQDAGEGTDFHAVGQGLVSITPLQIDLTHNQQVPVIRQWLAQ